MLALAELGPRICILGPSGAGKSTLAVALSRHLHAPAIFLDELFHLPNSTWLARPHDEFEALHAAAIAAPAWIIEGNYSRLLPSRLTRATGIIWLDMTRWAGLLGYIQRSLGRHRYGRVVGAPEHVNLKMLRYILLEQPRKRTELQTLVETQSVPVLRLLTRRELASCYREWGLRPSAAP